MTRISTVALCVLLALSGLSSQTWAAERKLLVAVVDYITWHDLLDEDVEAPAIRDLAQTGAVGMMCVRAARGYGGGYLTIGAGSRACSVRALDAEASIEAYAFDAAEPRQGARAARLFRSYTGWPAGDNAIVHLGIGELLRANLDAPYPLQLGLLGGTLRRSGLHVACVGNADTVRSVHREAAAIAMDGQGLVERGAVGARLARPDASVPYGRTTDGPRLLDAFRTAAASADVVVLDLGETSRAAEYAQRMPPTAARAARRRALQRADRLLGRILSSIRLDEWAVLILTPNIRAREVGEDFAALTPVIFTAPGAPAGLLTSPSTRRTGIVVNTDVAPTALEYFGLEAPPQALGRPMTREPAKAALAVLHSDLARHDVAHAVRRHAFRWLPILGSVALWLSAFLLLLRDQAPGWTRSLARALILLTLAAPPAMLLASLRPLSAAQLIAVVLALSAAIALVGAWFTGGRTGHVIPALLVVGLIVYDLVRGQWMLYWAPLGYSPGAGARFYGIGNEYAGVLLGASVVAAGALLSPRFRCGAGERVFIGLGVLAVAALVGLPRFGANLGMGLGCVIAAAVLALYLWRDRIGLPEVVAGILVALGLLGAAVTLDLVARGPEASHIGRLVAAVRHDGWQPAAQLVGRKVSMNWLLVRVSLWSDLALAAIAVLLVAIVAQPPRLLAAARTRDWLVPMVVACVAGAAAACLLNDSGIVAAALALLYGVGSLAYLGLGETPLEG
jgi:hypothetical protein